MKGKDPPPTLERLEPLCEPGKEEDTLEHQLMHWVLDNHVVEDVFGASMHREVVNRSACVLRFLAGMKRLGTSQLDMIWSSCLGKAEAELVEEIHTVLAGLMTALTPELVVHLLEGVRASIRDGALLEAVALSEKLAQVSLDKISQLGQPVLDSLLLLLWELMQQPAIRQHKAYDAIHDVLAQALKLVTDATRQYSFLQQSLEVVQRSAMERKWALEFDELSVINALQMTQFLLDIFDAAKIAEVIEQVALEQKLPDLLFQELAAFKHRCGLRAQAGRPDPPSVLEERIKLRLDVLRYVHGFSEKVQLSYVQVVAIWDVLDSPAEKELGMVFLSDACKVKGPMQMAFDRGVICQVFRDLICQRADWTLLGNRAYECFSYYLSGLKKQDETKTVGLDALWRIALTARTQSVAESATKDLLDVYEGGEGDVDGGGSRLQFLKRIFEHLAACRDELRNSQGNGSSVETSLKAERCLKLLQGAVENHKSQMGGLGLITPHGVRTEAGRRSIHIEPRKILPQGATLGGRNQTAQRLEAFSINMHPLETIGVLRRRAAARLEHPVMQLRLMVTGRQLSKDELTIAESGLNDGMEIQAILMPHKLGATASLQSTMGPAEDPAAMAVSNPTNGPSPPPPVGDLISREDSYCTILFELLESGTDSGVAAAIWELLLAIPTQRHALELVKLSAMGPDPTQDPSDGMSPVTVPEWSSLISPAKWDRSVYYLQIVDFLLQPSEDMAGREDLGMVPARDFLRALIRTGGFGHILDMFMHTGGDSTIQNMATAVALRIVKFCLFGQQQSPRSFAQLTSTSRPVLSDEGSSQASMMPVDTEDVIVEVDPTRLLGDGKRMRPLLDRLVTVASQTHDAAAVDGSWQVTVDALATIEMLLGQAEMVASLLDNPNVKSLFISILLRNPHAKARQQMGQLILSKATDALAPCFFQWGLEALEGLEPECDTCAQFFDVLQRLVIELAPKTTEAPTPTPAPSSRTLLSALARIVTERLASFPRGKETSPRYHVLRGYLRLLRELVVTDEEHGLFKGTALEDLIPHALDDMLFAVPGMDDKDNRPICAHTDSETRRLVFHTLQALVRQREEDLHQLLHHLLTFTDKGAKGLRHRWGYECSFDAKNNGLTYVGLRNQGCTCYMNSLLQQLFMIPQLRNALLSARVKRRRTLPVSDFSDEDLVNQRVILHWESGLQHEAQVTDYDSRTKRHVIKYDGSDDVVLNLREGRAEKETGLVEVIPAPKALSAQVATDKEATQRVLEQVQRTFCYLQWSEKRYFDPRPLVESCKCLNLNYSVYQQNDASEFCDKLLDKLEAALKGGPQAKELQMCFGGKFAYQKMPQDCEHRTEKEEPFIKVELIIRGKDSIQESLAAFVEGEMMDGENKVECEKCNTKKPTFRRTCLSQLPNVLILHLKRFDLDFSTFETVKLNNRCAFPMRLNVKPYTREGLEEAARAKAAEEEEGSEEGSEHGRKRRTVEEPEEGLPVPMVLDDGDYEYELKGVVIHAGVAQGGHYYSFIKDRNPEAGDSWYRFDDEDVQSFDPTHIEQYCFGGTTIKNHTWQGVTSQIEQERVANALMLFYEKVRPKVPTAEEEGEEDEAARMSTASTPTTPATAEPALADGLTAGAGGEGLEASDPVVVKMEVGGGTSALDGSGGAAENGEESKAPGGSVEVKAEGGSSEEADEMVDFVYGPDGRGAFEAEVWQANVAFIYHSYLFDQQFHAFLSGLLAMAFPKPPQLPTDDATQPLPTLDTLRTTAPAPLHLSSPSTSSSLPLPYGQDAVLASPTTPIWDPHSESSAALRMDVFRTGVLFLLDVILHSRERPGIQAWINHLKQALHSDIATASYLVTTLATTGASWLRTYFLECTDSTARNWVLQLVTCAVLELASQSESEKEALALPDASEAIGKSHVAVLLMAAMDLVLEANKFWRHTDELFLLFRDVARESTLIRDFLVRADLVSRLGLFVLGERVPPALRNAYGAVHWQQGDNVNHHAHDLLYLLETIVTLVGVPQIQKVPLLEEPSEHHTSAQDYRLTPAATAALMNIFAQYARNGTMGMHEILRYLEACSGGVSSQAVSHFQIKSMLQKYDTSAENRLTQNGFLTYYRDTAVYSAKSVWQDLHVHGFRNDLSQGRMGADYDIVELSSLPRLMLPNLSQLTLSLASFYVPLFDVLWNETTGILVRVCTENMETSDRIISQTLTELHHIVTHYTVNHHQLTSSTDVHVHMLSTLLAITDSQADERSELIFWGQPYGVAHTWLTKFQRLQQQNGQDYPLVQQVHHYALSVINDLFRRNPQARVRFQDRRPREMHALQQYASHRQQMESNYTHHSMALDYSPRRGGIDSDGEDSEEYEDGVILVSKHP